MHQFPCIFFHVSPGNADPSLLPFHFYVQVAMFADRQIKLGGLEVFGKIRVIVVFTVKFAETGNFTVQRKSCSHCIFQHFLIQYRKDSRQPQAYGAYVGIGVCTEGCPAAAENFRFCLEFCMNFQANHCFVLHSLISPFGAVLVNSG